MSINGVIDKFLKGYFIVRIGKIAEDFEGLIALFIQNLRN